MLESIFYGTSFGRDRLSPARIAYLLLIWLAIPMWLVMRYYAMILRTIFTLGLTIYSQVGHVDATFQEAYFTWTGDIGVRGLSIAPNSDESTQQRIEVKQILIDMPNWAVIEKGLGAFERLESSGTQSQLDAQALIDNIDHVGVSIEGMEYNFDQGFPDVLSSFGMASAAPFEAEGCKRDSRWIRAELANMGIVSHGVDIRLTASTHADLGEVHIEWHLDSPNSSRVDFFQHYKARGLFDFMHPRTRNRNSNYERIEVTDAGFTHARNAFCAKRDGISEEEFIGRHLDAIQRRLQANGVHAGADIERVYRSYLTHGSLKIEAKPSTTVNRGEYDQYSVVDQLRMYNAKISARGSPVPLMLELVPTRPIAARYEGSTWDLIAQEATNSDGAQQEIVTPSSSAQPAPAVATMPAIAPAATPHWASSLPEPTSASHGPAMLSYEDLNHHIGGRVLITTQFGDVRDVTIESYSKNEIGVRAYVTGGYMTQHIQRSQIRSIKDLD